MYNSSIFISLLIYTLYERRKGKLLNVERGEFQNTYSPNLFCFLNDFADLTRKKERKRIDISMVFIVCSSRTASVDTTDCLTYSFLKLFQDIL